MRKMLPLSLLALAALAAGCGEKPPEEPGVLLLEVPNPYYMFGDPDDAPGKGVPGRAPSAVKAPRDPAQPGAKAKTPAELLAAFKEAMLDFYANPVPPQKERDIHDAALACLWSQDRDTARAACESAERCRVYPLWRALRDFENRMEVMESRENTPHLEARRLVEHARKETELKGTFVPVDRGRGAFSPRSLEGQVCYLRAQYHADGRSGPTAIWVSERLAILDSDMATDALQDLLKDAEQEAKKDPEHGCRYMPELKNAVRLNELVRKAGSPTKVAAAFFSVDAFIDPPEAGFNR